MKMRTVICALPRNMGETIDPLTLRNKIPWTELMRAKDAKKPGNNLDLDIPLQLTARAGQTTSMGNLGVPFTQIMMDPLGWRLRKALSLRKTRDVIMIEEGLLGATSPHEEPHQDGNLKSSLAQGSSPTLGTFRLLDSLRNH